MGEKVPWPVDSGMPFPESSFSIVIKDDPSKIIKLTAPAMTWCSSNRLAMIFLLGKKKNELIIVKRYVDIDPFLACLVSQDSHSFYATRWNRLSFPVRHRLPIEYRCNAEKRRGHVYSTICVPLAHSQSAFLFAQTQQGRRGAARQGSRLRGPKPTRVIPYAFSFLELQ